MNMTEKSIPFAKPYFTDDDIAEINVKIGDILRSGWLTAGPIVKEFEAEFAKHVGAKHAVALNSCTAALHATFLALGIGDGDEVIVPSNTFVATANAALYVGAKPVFADSDPETFNISATDVQDKITRKTKAITVVHLGGNPCDMKELLDIADANNLLVIEDCAHAHGAKYRQKSCGLLGTAGCFSFYPTKVMTSGEGGMVTTDDEQLAAKIKVIRNIGRADYGPTAIQELGYNFRITDIQAAIGLAQLKHLNDYIIHRNSAAKFYNAELSEIDWLKLQDIRKGNLSSYYAYIVELTSDAPISRDDLASTMKQQGVGTSVLYHPVHLQPLYVKRFGFKNGLLPVAERLGSKSIALPLDNSISFDSQKRVVETLKQVTE